MRSMHEFSALLQKPLRRAEFDYLKPELPALS